MVIKFSLLVQFGFITIVNFIITIVILLLLFVTPNIYINYSSCADIFRFISYKSCSFPLILWFLEYFYLKKVVPFAIFNKCLRFHLTF